jgi:hypothetical protein
MATKTKQTPYERALTRAAQDDVQVERDYGDRWQVRGSDGVTHYTVQATENGLRCTCPSRPLLQTSGGVPAAPERAEDGVRAPRR